MSKLNVIDMAGTKTSDIELNKDIWNITPNEIVLKKAIKLQLDSLRQGTHKTKTRAEVSGGGRKPFKQKGTGRARQGSIRATQFRGGGIAFGVTPRSYSFVMNRKERVLALKSALSLKMVDKEITVVENLNLSSLKIKDGIKLISDLKLEGKLLFVTSGDAENLYMATRNLKNVQVIMAEELNVFDIVNASRIIVDVESVKRIEEVLS